MQDEACRQWQNSGAALTLMDPEAMMRDGLMGGRGKYGIKIWHKTSSTLVPFSGGFVPYFDAMGEEDVTIQNMARNMAPKILDRTSLKLSSSSSFRIHRPHLLNRNTHDLTEQ
jgi:hypothetical protein